MATTLELVCQGKKVYLAASDAYKALGRIGKQKRRFGHQKKTVYPCKNTRELGRHYHITGGVGR